MRHRNIQGVHPLPVFPFLFGGTFIEAQEQGQPAAGYRQFPFLFGGTFIEAKAATGRRLAGRRFPFLFGGTFIEADIKINKSKEKPKISLPFRRDFH